MAGGVDIAWAAPERRSFLPFIVAAIAVTLLLFYLMETLIHQDAALFDEEDRRVADIVMENVEIETNYEDRLPDKP